MRVIRNKTDRIEKIQKALATSDRNVAVGFPKGKASQSNIQKAIWNEFGTKGGASGGGWGGPIPERPFLRNTMRNNKRKYADAMKTSAKKILAGETTLANTLDKLGILAQGDVQKEITSLRTPPNAAVTIKLKGSSNPLIDTGAMRQAVTWERRR